MAKILITTSSFNCETQEIDALKKSGFEIVMNPHKRRLSEDEVSSLLNADIVGMIAGVEPLTRKAISGAKNLKIISRCGAGLDNVDMDAAKERGIAVVNTPDAPAKAVAELTLGLILSLLRGIPVQDQAIRKGQWERPMGRLLGEQTLGLIGYGRIGKRVAEQAKVFGANIIVHDPLAKNSAALPDLLAQSDIVSLHIPYTKENHHLVNAKFLQGMKRGALLINTARGELVDEKALLEALKSEALGGAALDVFEAEPYSGPLAGLANVVLTAHTGSYAAETRQQQETEAAQNLLKGLKVHHG